MAGGRAAQRGDEAFTRALRKAYFASTLLQQELAQRIGTSQGRMSRILTGDYIPAYDEVFDLEDALKLRPGMLSRHLGFVPLSVLESIERTVRKLVQDDDEAA